eukprot:3822940-Pyramimonas_sp.AAC.1
MGLPVPDLANDLRFAIGIFDPENNIVELTLLLAIPRKLASHRNHTNIAPHKTIILQISNARLLRDTVKMVAAIPPEQIT